MPATSLGLRLTTSSLPPNSRRKQKGNMAKKTLESSDPPPVSGAEWPCKPTAELGSGWPSSWPTTTTQSHSQPHLPANEEAASAAANKAQLPALIAVSEYLNCMNYLDDEDEEDLDNEEEGFDDYEFFAKLFKQDDSLREYYEKNRDSGVFCCLVCCAVREKGWKRFKDGSGLVQHSIAIAKTKKRRAHRAYAQVVCEILGWDFNRLRSVGESSEGKVDEGVEDSLSAHCNATKSVSIGDTEVYPSKETLISENQQEEGGGSTKSEENSGSKASADGLSEDLTRLTLETVKVNAEDASSCVEHSKECAVAVNEEKDYQEEDDVHKNTPEDHNRK